MGGSPQLMYGCSKPGRIPYKLTHIFDQSLNTCNLKKYSNLQLIKLLSTRDCKQSNSSLNFGHH
jgi:hypothetical protein